MEKAVKWPFMPIPLIGEWEANSSAADGCSVYGGAVAASVKSRVDASIVLSKATWKQLEFVALNVETAKGL